MSWISDAGAGRRYNLRQHALPDFRFSAQLYGTHGRTVGEGWTYPDHDHPLFELNLVLEGRQTMTLDGVDYEQREGDLLLIQPGVAHRSRIGPSPSMTYFCLHLDVDDAVCHGRLAGLGNRLFAADSDAARRLRPYFDALAARADEAREGGADDGFAQRAAALQMLLALAEYAGEARHDGRGADGQAEHANPARPAGERSGGEAPAVQRLRERNALEKRVQELLRAPEGDGGPGGRALPPFRWAGVFSVMIPDRGFWTKPERFWAKVLLEDALAPHGNAVVIVGEQLMTAVLLSDRLAVPPIEEHAARSKSLLEKNLGVAIRLGIGGIARGAGELRGLYKQSLSGLDAAELFPAPGRDAGFVGRIVRLALLMIEADHADPGLTLNLLAKRLELTPNYLSALFTAETGRPFTWHLSRYRIDRAKALLRETNMKVYQVGKQVGYADQAYFSRLFKAVVGASPGEYRSGAPAD
ncbi:AraC-like ligand binding domain-containing protein [Paenibacillus sp. UNC496MF]|uniref:AraC family transcriptional regulator n=1 Tax=Paenibacillus sp. UNC496MF TaxID=1502753 RepID=UPI0008E27880|nr:helix-turn-helix domain-containing protein [Paenibacillus sp. UNC496MF]SFJ78861.1 AraC-like ligand binding domain-containing protein [Paenibacillus sp. UNC496MF]